MAGVLGVQSNIWLSQRPGMQSDTKYLIYVVDPMLDVQLYIVFHTFHAFIRSGCFPRCLKLNREISAHRRPVCKLEFHMLDPSILNQPLLVGWKSQPFPFASFTFPPILSSQWHLKS